MTAGNIPQSTRSVAVVGMGAWGQNLVRNFHQLGALSAVCDSREDAEAACGREYPSVPFFRDYEVLLASSDITAIALATPAVRHFEMATAALAAGKDVFVEKPLAVQVGQGETLVRLADSA
jgi:UDP-2-acetamido-3-amino-2,3-dideoxy-glucuronate N-acetyltransferase